MGRKVKREEDFVSILIDYQDFFNTEKGKNILFDLCKRFHYFNSSYTGDVNEMIFREGERNVVNMIITNLQQDPGKLLNEFRRRLKEEIQYED